MRRSTGRCSLLRQHIGYRRHSHRRYPQTMKGFSRRIRAQMLRRLEIPAAVGRSGGSCLPEAVLLVLQFDRTRRFVRLFPSASHTQDRVAHQLRVARSYYITRKRFNGCRGLLCRWLLHHIHPNARKTRLISRSSPVNSLYVQKTRIRCPPISTLPVHDRFHGRPTTEGTLRPDRCLPFAHSNRTRLPVPGPDAFAEGSGPPVPTRHVLRQ